MYFLVLRCPVLICAKFKVARRHKYKMPEAEVQVTVNIIEMQIQAGTCKGVDTGGGGGGGGGPLGA